MVKTSKQQSYKNNGSLAATHFGNLVVAAIGRWLIRLKYFFAWHDADRQTCLDVWMSEHRKLLSSREGLLHLCDWRRGMIQPQYTRRCTNQYYLYSSNVRVSRTRPIQIYPTWINEKQTNTTTSQKAHTKRVLYAIIHLYLAILRSYTCTRLLISTLLMSSNLM